MNCAVSGSGCCCRLVLTVWYPVQVIDGHSVLKVSNGHLMLQRITASGCTVTALIAAFLTLIPNNPQLATAYALGVFGCALSL